jgi:hypothetical protein
LQNISYKRKIKRSPFWGLFTINNTGELPDNHTVICKKDTGILYKLHLFAENENGIVVGSVGGIKDNNNNWELIALYVDENVIGDTKFALSMVKEFAKRVKDAGSTIFTTGKKDKRVHQ